MTRSTIGGPVYFRATFDALVLFRRRFSVPKVTPMMSLQNIRTRSSVPALKPALFIVRSMSPPAAFLLKSPAALYLVRRQGIPALGEGTPSTWNGLPASLPKRAGGTPKCSPRGWELRRIQRQREKTKRFQYAMMPWLAAAGPLLWAGHQAFVWAQALPQ